MTRMFNLQKIVLDKKYIMIINFFNQKFVFKIF